MLSQRQNPPAVSHSLQQEAESKEMNPEQDNRAFSIRQYALASRQKGIFNNWPFPEKFLQICLNHGVQNVLPPFELLISPDESVQGCSNLNCSQDDKNVDFCQNEVSDIIEQKQNIKNDFDLYSNEDGPDKPASQHYPSSDEEGSHRDCNARLATEADTFTMQSPSHVRRSNTQTKTSSKKTKDKRRRRKGRCKKRSMVDIIAAAKPRSVEDLYWDNNLSYYEPANEGCYQMVPLVNNSQPELKNEGLRREEERGCLEVAKVDTTEKRTCIVKIKLNSKSDP